MSERIHAEPVRGRFCGLWLTHEEFAGERIRFRFPEGIVYYDGAGEFHLFSFGEAAPAWQELGEDSYSHRRSWAGVFEYEVSAKGEGEVVELRAAVRNISGETLSRVELAPCIQLAEAGTLDDPGMTRTFYRAGGGFLSAAGARRPNDPGKNQFSVTEEIGFRWSLSKAESDYGWGLGSPDADAGFIAVTSRDGRGGLATRWRRVATLCNNTTASIHCVHAEPYFGTLSPGETRENAGCLVWSREGSLEELWERSGESLRGAPD